MQCSVFRKIHNQRKEVKTSILQTNTMMSESFLCSYAYQESFVYATEELLSRTDLAWVSKGTSWHIVPNSPLTATGKDSELRLLLRVNSRKALGDFEVIRCLTEDTGRAL